MNVNYHRVIACSPTAELLIVFGRGQELVRT
jgi:hypothetical protein